MSPFLALIALVGVLEGYCAVEGGKVRGRIEPRRTGVTSGGGGGASNPCLVRGGGASNLYSVRGGGVTLKGPVV